MNCRVEYIELAYRNSNPEFADFLTQQHRDTFEKLKQNGFSKSSEGKYKFASAGTKTYRNQQTAINSINKETPVPIVTNRDGNVAVNVVKARSFFWDKFSPALEYVDGTNDGRSDVSKDLTIKERLFNGKDEVSVTEILNNIKQNPFFSLLANKLLKQISSSTDIQVKLVRERRVYGGRGVYYPAFANQKARIEIAELAEVAKGNADGIVLHEIIHALTIPLLRSETKISNDWYALWEYANSVVKEDHYGLKNSEEFASELFTNGKFIQTLKKYPASNLTKYKNLWEEILSFIKNLLGFQNNSLYDEAVAMLSNVIEQQATTTRERENEENYYNSFYGELKKSPAYSMDVKEKQRQMFNNKKAVVSDTIDNTNFKQEEGTSDVSCFI